VRACCEVSSAAVAPPVPTLGTWRQLQGRSLCTHTRTRLRDRYTGEPRPCDARTRALLPPSRAPRVASGLDTLAPGCQRVGAPPCSCSPALAHLSVP
jgi:hypothetical protein